MTITVNGPNGVVINFPDGTDNATIDKAMRQAAGVGDQPKGFVANVADFFKSIPRGIVSGLTSAPNPSMVPGLEQEAEAVAPTRERATQALQAPLPAPQGPWGQAGVAVGEGVGNPYSYLGPGSIGLKVGGAVASSLGAEGGRKLAEGTPFEKPAQIGGAVLGGTAAYKTLGPTAPKAAVPTPKELKAVGGAGIQASREMPVELSPQVMSGWAAQAQQELAKRFRGGQRGTAPQTFDILDELRNPPASTAGQRTILTAADLDTIWGNLRTVAKETRDFKPTPDAAAATSVLKRFDDLVENPPPGLVVAGDAKAYLDTLRRGNANYAAGSRSGEVQKRLTKAERKAQEQKAGSIEDQTKIKLGQLRDNETKTRGFNEAELKQLDLAREGTFASNTLRQFGRGGTGVIPLGAHIGAAAPNFLTLGPLGVAAQALLAGGLYGAKKGSEKITRNRAKELVEMLAKRSPEYEARVRNLPPADTTTGTAAIIRALLNAQ
jgi:hypothetical protein